MERASVEAALAVEPPTAVELHWSADDTVVTIVPVGHWAADTYHTITVQPGALAGTGRPLTKPVRAAFLTRGPATAVVAATDEARRSGSRSTPRSPSRSIARWTPRASPRPSGSSPRCRARLTVEAGRRRPAALHLHAERPSRPNTRYTLVVEGVTGRDGVAVEPIALAVRTAVAPTVVRFRPRPHAGRGAATDISVRFSRPMDRASTKAAFKVLVDGKAIKGKVTFAEEDTVLVFDPAKNFAYDTRVVATVAAVGAQRRRRAPQARRAGRVPHRAQARSRKRPAARDLERRSSTAIAAAAPPVAAAGRRWSATTWA